MSEGKRGRVGRSTRSWPSRSEACGSGSKQEGTSGDPQNPGQENLLPVPEARSRLYACTGLSIACRSRAEGDRESSRRILVPIVLLP